MAVDMRNLGFDYEMTPLEMVREFREKFGKPLNQKWRSLNGREEYHQQTLIGEESDEFEVAVEPVEILKELADLVYVCNDYAATFGWDLDEAFRRVHASNMSKLWEDGKPRYREDGKVLKPPTYVTPDLSDLV